MMPSTTYNGSTMKFTYEQIRKALVETLEEAAKDGAVQKKYRDSFIRMIKKANTGPQKKGSAPFTKKATVGKSGPVGMP
tara:strand:- start:1251 stop:1487 length:237 start_codon:yes stop_codon:yes gene_type:complete